MEAFLREEKKKKVEELRNNGFIPAVVYGPGLDNLNLKVSKKDFLPVFKEAGESELVDLEVKEKNKKFSVLIKEIQRDNLSDEIIHVDFYQPKAGEEIEINVPLNFINEAPVTKKGGTVVTVMKEVSVKCMPKDMPRELNVDLSSLEDFDSQIYLRDLDFPKGVEPLVDKDTIVVSVSEPTTEGETEATAEEEQPEEPPRKEEGKEKKEEN